MTSFDIIGARLSDGPRLVGAKPLAPEATRAGEGEGKGGAFAEALFDALHRVDALQRDAAEHSTALASGQTSDVHSLMVAMGKSEVAFNLMLEVRNKIVDAWQTLTRTVV